MNSTQTPLSATSRQEPLPARRTFGPETAANPCTAIGCRTDPACGVIILFHSGHEHSGRFQK